MYDIYDTYAKYRDERGMTDYRVCQLTGIETGTMSNWKMGRYTPKVDKLVKIARVFGITLDELLFGKDEKGDH